MVLSEYMELPAISWDQHDEDVSWILGIILVSVRVWDFIAAAEASIWEHFKQSVEVHWQMV